jgi:steroid delta-isomerase-like uncharacterized protein
MKSILTLTKITFPITLFLLFLSFGCQQKAKDVLTEKEAKVLLDRYMETMNKADLDLVDKIISTDFVLRTPLLPKPLVGIENYKTLVINTSKTFSDFKATIDEVIVKGDKMWGRFLMEGVNTGPLSSIPATGKKFRVTGLAITRVANGMIVEDETFWNVLSLYQQLGFTLIPPQKQFK